MKRSGFKKPATYAEAKERGYDWRRPRRPLGFSGRKQSARMKRFAKTNQYKEEQWKKAVRARDGFQCQFPKCFYRDRSIDVHHIAMRSRRPDLKFVQTNGTCLCREHHTWVHAHETEAVRMGLLSTETYEAARKELVA